MLRNVDLHLLACFDALISERQVTRAAGRMGMSQPAMSNALGRLRVLFGDPLLVRTPGGMVPTARALDLADTVRCSLRRIGEALASSKPFDPASARQTVNVMTTDYAAEALMPALMARLFREAPNLQVAVQPMSPSRVREQLQEGSSHLVIGYFRDLPKELYASALLTEPIVCVARHDHPAIEDTLSLGCYARLRHAYFAGFPHSGLSTAEKVTDEALASLGLQRDITFRTGYVLIMLPVIAETDLVATLPLGAVQSKVGHFRLRVLPLPFHVPDLHLSLIWHERTHRDNAHQWLRAIIRDVARQQKMCRDIADGGR